MGKKSKKQSFISKLKVLYGKRLRATPKLIQSYVGADAKTDLAEAKLGLLCDDKQFVQKIFDNGLLFNNTFIFINCFDGLSTEANVTRYKKLCNDVIAAFLFEALKIVLGIGKFTKLQKDFDDNKITRASVESIIKAGGKGVAAQTIVTVLFILNWAKNIRYEKPYVTPALMYGMCLSLDAWNSGDEVIYLQYEDTDDILSNAYNSKDPDLFDGLLKCSQDSSCQHVIKYVRCATDHLCSIAKEGRECKMGLDAAEDDARVLRQQLGEEKVRMEKEVQHVRHQAEKDIHTLRQNLREERSQMEQDNARARKHHRDMVKRMQRVIKGDIMLLEEGRNALQHPAQPKVEVAIDHLMRVLDSMTDMMNSINEDD